MFSDDLVCHQAARFCRRADSLLTQWATTIQMTDFPAVSCRI